MTTLDRHIARSYLVNTALLLAILFLFVVAVDVSINFDEYTRAAGESLRASRDLPPPTWFKTMVFASGLILDLWWPRLIQLGVYILGLVSIAAAGFTLTQMVRHRELVAMLASGISLWRAARPILACAAFLALGQLAVQEFVLPRIAPLLTRDAQQAGRRTLGASRLRLTPDAQGRVFHAASFDADAGVLTDLCVIERDAAGQATRSITADRAVWVAGSAGSGGAKGNQGGGNGGGGVGEGGAGGGGGAWVLERGFARSFSDQGGLPAAVDRIQTNLDPMTLKIRRFAGFRNSLSFSQVSQMLRRPELLADPSRARIDELERIRFGRFGVVGCNLLGLIMCLPLFLRREPIPMMLPAVKATPIAMLALLGGVLGTTLAIPALPPELGVFLPALALLPLAIASATSIKT